MINNHKHLEIEDFINSHPMYVITDKGFKSLTLRLLIDEKMPLDLFEKCVQSILKQIQIVQYLEIIKMQGNNLELHCKIFEYHQHLEILKKYNIV
jgi:hypothetical protein